MRTVYYVTNRVVTGDPTQWQSYTDNIIAPNSSADLTYGTAFVDDSNLTADSAGSISTLQTVGKGGFSADAAGDLSSPGCNLIVFIHGFDNSFNDAITRAAYLQQWYAASGVAAANTKVVAFAWPSLGELFDSLDLTAAYRRDQGMAGQSGVHVMDFFSRLQPLLATARRHGARVILLAHSMGNWALQAGLTNWFLAGNGPARMFDEALLAAADEVDNSFSAPKPTRLSALGQLAARTSIYFSNSDLVLKLSAGVNLVARLGQDGPPHRTDPGQFPPPQFRMIDCSALRDFDWGLQNSHQYYRRSPSARADIAAVIAGQAAVGQPTIVLGANALV